MINWKDYIRYTIRDIRSKAVKPISGLWLYCGLYGSGKTLSMTNEAIKASSKGFSIYSNYGINGQNGNIVSWKDILEVPPNSIICLDEISNLINSRDWKNLPPEFFSLLTQNRKLNIRVMATAQVFEDVDRQFRTLTKYIIQCSKFGRVITNRFYNQQGYNHTPDKRKLLFKEKYVATDAIYNSYDTMEFIEKLKTTTEYVREVVKQSFDVF